MGDDMGAAATARVLVVAPPGPWRDESSYALAQAWFEVATLDDGVDIVEGLVVPGADLAIVDLGLRRPPGVMVCAALRERSSVVLLAVGANQTEDDVVEACNLGVDGFLNMASSPRVLLARVRGLLRRIPIVMRTDGPGTATCGGLALDVRRGVLTVRGEPLALRPAEQELLGVLLLNLERVVSRSELESRLAILDGPDADLGTSLRRLRDQLDLTASGCTIRTVRKVGVRLLPKEADQLVPAVEVDSAVPI